MCGEKGPDRARRPCGGGSPPRVRGEVDDRPVFERYDRITPACAGRRPFGASAQTSPPDHPRVCGEKSSPKTRKKSAIGSPPRVRGEAPHPVVGPLPKRITPACAGRSPWSCSPRAQDGDHPRVCGEKDAVQPRNSLEVGSPPRVRGEVSDSVGLLTTEGITPACAGRSLRLKYGIV